MQLQSREDAEMRETEGWGPPTMITYNWSAEDKDAAAHGCTSGAAAVRKRRHEESCVRETGTAVAHTTQGRGRGGNGTCSEASNERRTHSDERRTAGEAATSARKSLQQRATKSTTPEDGCSLQSSQSSFFQESSKSSTISRNTDKDLRFTERAFAEFVATIGLPGPAGIG